MQIRYKPGNLEDKNNTIKSGFNSKIMQKHSKLGNLEDYDPINNISKINFISWIRGFYKHLYIFVSFFFWDQNPKIKFKFSPKIMQIYYKIIGLEDQDPKIKFKPKIMQINCKQGGLEMFGGSGSKN